MKFLSSLSITLLTSSLLLFTACSDNNNNDDVVEEEIVLENPLTGYVIDSGVKGFAYKCSPSGESGVTDEDGTYICEEGESVEFSVCGQSLGSMTAQKYITPSVIFPGDDEASLNLAQLLQSIDKDSNTSNGIEIDETLCSSLTDEISFTDPEFDTKIGEILQKNGRTLVDKDTATKHLNDTYVKTDIDEDGTKRTYEWKYGEWGNCAGACGTDNALKTREVTCEDSIGTQDETKCDADTKPENTQECTASACPTTPTPTATPNRAPVFTSDENQSVEEGGVIYGAPALNRSISRAPAMSYPSIILTATDADNDAITYSISGGDFEKFDINDTTGVVTFNIYPDFETKRTYLFTATATDTKNASTTQDVNISITDKEDVIHNSVSYGSVVSPFTDKLWLDRNLGAAQACTALDDTACYGDYYQWGRNADGHENNISGNLETNSTRATDINTTDLGQEGQFITATYIAPLDWVANGVDDNGLLRIAEWSKTDGTSVCPVGFRLPTIDELRAETINEDVSDSTTAFANFLKLPSAGARNGSYGHLYDQGSSGYIWSSTVYNSNANSIAFRTTGGAFTGGDGRAYGFPVRCIQDNSN